MFQIRRIHKQAIIDHAQSFKPIEACGLLAAATYGGNAQSRLIRMNNVAEEWGDSFEFEPEQQLAVWNDLEERGEVVAAIYHSHTKHSAYPSARDIAGARAVDPRTVHIVVSVMSEITETRAFSISPGGTVCEVELEEIE